MRHQFILIVSFVFIVFSSHAQDFVFGKVFNDLNNNRIYDSNEQGVAAVAVSNGKEVVTTDEQGNYQIQALDGQAIFVIKPAGYLFPVNTHQLPQFYQHHKPKGSPELKYSGISPVSALEKPINFPLIATEENDQFSILVFSDPQPYEEKHIAYYGKDIVDPLVGNQSHAFGITLGDIVGDQLDFFDQINAQTARIGLPWFHVIGNHDLNFDATNMQHADETFERVYGPSHYAFNHGKVHFIVLNNIIYPNHLTNYSYVGGFTEMQLEFVKHSLAHVPKDHLVVLFMHIPLYNIPEWGTTFIEAHRHALFALLEDRPHTFSLSGHMHTQLHHFFGEDDGWNGKDQHHHYTVGTASGDWWSGAAKTNGVPESTMSDGTPNGYNILHFNGNQYSWDYKIAADNPDQRMRIYGPRLMQNDKTNRAEFYVNFFQGSEDDQVFYRIDKQDFTPMRKVREQDPYMAAIRAKWDQAAELPEGVRPSNPSVSEHLWKVRMPRQLKPGKHRIEVKVLHGEKTFFDSFEFVQLESAEQ